MGRRRGNVFRKLAKACFVWLLVTAWFAPTSAWASTYNVTGLSDWYFYLEQETEVTLYGNSNEACSEIDWTNNGTDPYLFLYDYDNNDSYLTEDDDANHNDADQCVSSKITGTYPAGIYRIRAGYWDENSGSTVNGTTGNPDYYGTVRDRRQYVAATKHNNEKVPASRSQRGPSLLLYVCM